jgi:hypothetical protein
MRDDIMKTKKDFITEVRKSLSAMPLQPVAIDPALKHIEMPGGGIDIEIYKADKLEKIVLSAITIKDPPVVEASILVWPDDNHNLPILWSNLTMVESIMNVPIFDFIPLMDIVMWPDYAETYVSGIADLKAKALEIFGDTVIDKSIDLSSLTVYTLSPYRAVIKISDDGVERVPEAADAYIQAYIQLWKKAMPVPKADMDFYRKKKEATRMLMKNNDPGYPLMIDVFGEENTKKIFDAIF